MEIETEIAVIGGGTGGCAAALAAASLGRRVVMTEEYEWIGGQLTSQSVPPDEHAWIEKCGCTRSYRRYRDGVRAYYRAHYPLTPEARAEPHLNPGGGIVSALCHEPRVGLAVLHEMLAPFIARGLVRIMTGWRPIAAEKQRDRIASVELQHLTRGETCVIRAPYFLDATELGDLLALGGVEYVTGAESRKETGEPHAVAGEAEPENVQATSWCFAMSHDPNGNYVIDKPAGYDRWRSHTPTLTPPWAGPQLSWYHSHYQNHSPLQSRLFPSEDPAQFSFWKYRKIVDGSLYPEGLLPETTLVNWPMIDYMEASVIDKEPVEARRIVEDIRQLSLSFFYWMQTEAPRPDGGTGHPGLYLRPDLMGTDDGLAMAPYFRESRRIRAEFTVTELHVGFEATQGRKLKPFADSVGIGAYNIDLHPSTNGHNYIDIPAIPFQIPLGSLVPVRVDNLLPACKNLGVTHLTNGCYRLHPVEWNIGEAAGALAAYCLEQKTTPRAVYHTDKLRSDFQNLLVRMGVELAWLSVDTPYNGLKA
ncbi:FAD-dependent oxidoreductase [soil metagenome]